MNILGVIAKEQEKGNKYIMPDGKCVPEDYLANIYRKEYFQKVKEDKSLEKISPAAYVTEQLGFVPRVEGLAKAVSDYLTKDTAKSEDTEDAPEDK